MYKKIIIYLIFICLLLIFLVSGYNIITWFNDKTNTEKNIKKIYDNVIINEIPINNIKEEVIENTTTNKENSHSNYENINLIDADLNKLKSINNDIKGWIQVNGTNVNYPFVQTDNNSYYLTHSFDKSYNKAGWVFLDYRNSSDLSDKNTIIYAHGRLDYTMFGSLRNTLKKSWFNNKNNHILKISTDDKNSLWQIFSVYKIPTTNDYLKINFTNMEFEEFTNKIIKRSLFNFNTEVSKEDKIVTLSTCHDKNYKIVMHAKLIKYNSK